MEKRITDAFKTVEDLFNCTICYNTLASPTQTPCGHLFCGDCVKTIVKQGRDAKCPICRASLSRRSVRLRDDISILNFAVRHLGQTITKGLEPPSSSESSGSTGYGLSGMAETQDWSGGAAPSIVKGKQTKDSSMSSAPRGKKRRTTVSQKLDVVIAVAVAPVAASPTSMSDKENVSGKAGNAKKRRNSNKETPKTRLSKVTSRPVFEPEIEIHLDSIPGTSTPASLDVKLETNDAVEIEEDSLLFSQPPPVISQCAFPDFNQLPASHLQNQPLGIDILDDDGRASSSSIGAIAELSPQLPFMIQAQALDLRVFKSSNERKTSSLSLTIERNRNPTTIQFVKPLDLTVKKRSREEMELEDRKTEISKNNSQLPCPPLPTKAVQVHTFNTSHRKIFPEPETIRRAPSSSLPLDLSPPIPNVPEQQDKQQDEPQGKGGETTFDSDLDLMFFAQSQSPAHKKRKCDEEMSSPDSRFDSENGRLEVEAEVNNDKSISQEKEDEEDEKESKATMENVVARDSEEEHESEDIIPATPVRETESRKTIPKRQESRNFEPITEEKEGFDEDVVFSSPTSNYCSAPLIPEADEEKEKSQATDKKQETCAVVTASPNDGETSSDSHSPFASPLPSPMNWTAQIKLTPTPVKPVRRFVFCPTRLNRIELARLNELCSFCNGTVSREYTTDVTHLVIKLEKQRVAQTIKYLFAIADKKWVITYDWILECLRQNEMVSEESFEVSNFPECDSGARKSRETPTQLLTGVCCYFPSVIKSSDVSLDDCKTLIRKMGGTIVNNPCEVDSKTTVMVIGEPWQNKHIYEEWYNSKGWLSIGWTWILDCLLSYSIVPFNKTHILTKVHDSKEVRLPAPLMNANASSRFFSFPLSSKATK